MFISYLTDNNVCRFSRPLLYLTVSSHRPTTLSTATRCTRSTRSATWSAARRASASWRGRGRTAYERGASARTASSAKSAPTVRKIEICHSFQSLIFKSEHLANKYRVLYDLRGPVIFKNCLKNLSNIKYIYNVTKRNWKPP